MGVRVGVGVGEKAARGRDGTALVRRSEECAERRVFQVVEEKREKKKKENP